MKGSEPVNKWVAGKVTVPYWCRKKGGITWGTASIEDKKSDRNTQVETFFGFAFSISIVSVNLGLSVSLEIDPELANPEDEPVNSAFFSTETREYLVVMKRKARASANLGSPTPAKHKGVDKEANYDIQQRTVVVTAECWCGMPVAK